ncbi:UNVERIFIED_CONTAM: hypothetical protein RKD50_008645 [Streptomyces canus]
MLCAPLGVVLWANTEATWKRSKHPALRVGLRLPAVVDPADHLFRVDL